MSAEFDPYHKWLGIPPQEQPPNFYRLLGVAALETDRDVIANAADQRMAHLRTFATGQHSTTSQKILNQVAAAKVCLLNVEKKAAYDLALRKQMAGAGKKSPPPVPRRASAPAAAQSVAAGKSGKVGGATGLEDLESVLDIKTDRPRAGSSSTQAGRSNVAKTKPTAADTATKASPLKWAIPLAAVVVIAAGGGIAFMLNQGDKKPEVAGNNGSNGGSTTKPNDVPEPDKNPEKHPTETPGVEKPDPGKVTPEDPDPIKTPAVDPTVKTPPDIGPNNTNPNTANPNTSNPNTTNPPRDQSSQFRTHATAARAALSNRNAQQANTAINAARLVATQQEQLDECNRLMALQQLNAQFWNAVRQNMNSLKAGDEVEVGGEPAIIVGSEQSRLTLRSGAKTVTYPLRDLPADLSIVLANRTLGNNRNEFQILLGAFHTTDRFGKREEARGTWAAIGLNNVRVKQLLPELDAEYPRATQTSIASTRPTPPKVDNKTPTKSPDPPKVVKTAPPENGKLKTAQDLIKDIYKEDFAAAKNRSARTALAKKLLQQGVETKDDPVNRYALLREAALLAGESGEAETVIEAIDEMDRNYTVEPLKLKVATLTRVKEIELSPAEGKSLVESEIELIDEALALDEYELASQMSTAALSLARKKASALAGSLTAKNKEIAKAQAEFAKVKEALDTLKTTPNDPEANKLAGTYYAFSKGDFAKGLPLLKLSSDETLKKLAEKDLANPDTTEARIEVADAWWDFADAQELAAKRAVQVHAGRWYDQALADATGLSKAKIEKRLASLKESAPATGSTASSTAVRKPGTIKGVARVFLDLTKAEAYKKSWTLEGAATIDGAGVHLGGRAAELKSIASFQGDAHIIIQFNSTVSRYQYYNVEIWGETFDFSGRGPLLVGIYRSGAVVQFGRANVGGGLLDDGYARQRVIAQPTLATPLVIKPAYSTTDGTVKAVEMKVNGKNIIMPK